MNSNEDRDLLRRSLGATNALISAMESAQRSNTGYHWLNWNSFKKFAQRYMVIINQLPEGFCSPLNLIRYDTDAMPGPPRSTASYQRTVFESVYADLLVLRSYIENAIGSTGDERRALTDFFQSRLRPAMLEEPNNEKEVQDTVERLLIGRGLQKGQEYDRETGRVKVSSKECIPDFILPRLQEAIEIKLIKDRRRIGAVIDEINADIAAYSKIYDHLLFLVYDLGQIKDEVEFRHDLESAPNVQVVVVKH